MVLSFVYVRQDLVKQFDNSIKATFRCFLVTDDDRYLRDKDGNRLKLNELIEGIGNEMVSVE